MDLEKLVNELRSSCEASMTDTARCLPLLKGDTEPQSNYEKEALVCAVRILQERLLARETQIVDLTAQLELAQEWKRHWKEAQKRENAAIGQLATLQTQIDATTESIQSCQSRVPLLTRRNLELQQKCDEYYRELQSLRRRLRRHDSLSKEPSESLYCSLSHLQTSDHSRKHSAYI